MENSIEVVNGKIIVAEEICKKMVELTKAKKELEKLEKDVWGKLQGAMLENGVTKWENDYFTATITTRKTKSADMVMFEALYPQSYADYLSCVEENESVPYLTKRMKKNEKE